jgi:hypothetical protein
MFYTPEPKLGHMQTFLFYQQRKNRQANRGGF